MCYGVYMYVLTHVGLEVDIKCLSPLLVTVYTEAGSQLNHELTESARPASQLAPGSPFPASGALDYRWVSGPASQAVGTCWGPTISSSGHTASALPTEIPPAWAVVLFYGFGYFAITIWYISAPCACSPHRGQKMDSDP